MIEIAFTFYPDQKDLRTATVWDAMPQVPAEGQTVHLPFTNTDDEPDSMAFEVRRVSWAGDHPDHPGWHAEVWLDGSVRNYKGPINA